MLQTALSHPILGRIACAGIRLRREKACPSPQGRSIYALTALPEHVQTPVQFASLDVVAPPSDLAQEGRDGQAADVELSAHVRDLRSLLPRLLLRQFEGDHFEV
jgi:hypothetical protein